MKKKILCLVQLPPPLHGASFMNQVSVNTFKENDIDAEILELSFSKKLDEIRSFSIRKILLLLKLIFKLTFCLSTNKYSLVYFNFSPTGVSFYRDLIILVFIKLFCKNNIVLHIHGNGFNKQTNKKYTSFLYKKIFKNIHIICLSENLVHDVNNYAQHNNIHILHNGVEPASNCFSLKKDPKKILFLSNLVEQKGILDFLLILQKLYKENVDFTATVAGGWRDDGCKNKVDAIISEFDSKLKDKINFIGSVYGQEKISTFQESGIFIFPSKFDTFPLVLLEAMDSGQVIISTDVGGIKDIVSNGVNGFICDIGDINKMSSLTKRLIEEEQLFEKMSYSGKKKFNENYTIEIYKKNLISIVLEIINKTG